MSPVFLARMVRNQGVKAGKLVELHDTGSGSFAFLVVRAEDAWGRLAPTQPMTFFVQASDFERVHVAIMQQMRDWVADCQWREDEEELSELTDAQVCNGIARHYAGGIAQFIKDAEPVRQ